MDTHKQATMKDLRQCRLFLASKQAYVCTQVIERAILLTPAFCYNSKDTLLRKEYKS